jgi:hypothetical protein
METVRLNGGTHNVDMVYVYSMYHSQIRIRFQGFLILFRQPKRIVSRALNRRSTSCRRFR